MRNTTGVASEEGTAYTSGIFTFIFVSRARVAQSLVFCVLFCKNVFVPFLVAIVLSVLLFKVSDYKFSIFKLFLNSNGHESQQAQQNKQTICF